MNKENIDRFLRLKPLTIILVGQTACGKKTMWEMLTPYLKKIDPRRKAVVSESGELFRTTISTMNPHLRLRVGSIQRSGNLQSSGLTLGIVIPFLIKALKTNQEHLVMDGSFRRVGEVLPMMDFLMESLVRMPIIVHIKISDETARERIAKRNAESIKKKGAARMETANPQAIDAKLAYYHSHVIPTLRAVPEELVVEISGEPEPEKVFAVMIKEIAKAVKHRDRAEKNKPKSRLVRPLTPPVMDLEVEHP